MAKGKKFLLWWERDLVKKVTLLWKKYIIKIKILMVTKKQKSHKTTRSVKIGGPKILETFANFAKCYREKFHKLASSFIG
jgi:hypothetical protein